MICSDCGHSCEVVTVDNGIGPYEFWGDRGVHHDYAAGSDCCGEPVEEGGSKTIRRSSHTARRYHKDGRIKKGDRYSLVVTHHWRADGPSWITQRKVRHV